MWRDLGQGWSLDPFDAVVLLVLAVHARGMRIRLRAIRRAGRPTAPWRGQAVLFRAGLAVLVLAVSSPLDYRADSYLTAHIVQHILLGFVAPTLIVLGAPWVPLLRGLPQPVAAGWGRLLQRTRPGRAAATGSATATGTAAATGTATGTGTAIRSATVRSATVRSATGTATRTAPPAGRLAAAAVAVRRIAARPWTSVLLFNLAMVFWHVPGPFALAADNRAVHVLLAHGTFFGFGVALFLQVYGSYPFRPALPPSRRVAALVATNAVMVGVAMTLVMFSHNLYPLYAVGHTPEQQAADQQIAGAILWVCGEITFLPSILFLVARALVDPADRTATGPGAPVRAAEA